MPDIPEYFVMSGGQYNNVGRDQINVTNIQLVVSQSAPGPIMIPTACRKTEAPSHSVAHTLGSSIPELDPFLTVEFLLQAISHLVDTSPANLTLPLRKNLLDLGATIALCKRAHLASRRTSVFPLLRRQIIRRMERCAETLLRVHRQISRLPPSSTPGWRDIGRLLLLSLVDIKNEPEDVLSIRLEVVGELELLGAYLGSLKLLAQTPGIWPSTSSTGDHLLTVQDLKSFFEAGSPSLQSLRVEKIIVIEPLGRSLSIPLCFAESLEDIHHFLQLGCQGSKSGMFIENRQYELDDSSTNKTIIKKDLGGHLTHGSVLEVSILVQAVGIELSRCPRCGELGEKPEDGWIRCKGCLMLFNAGEAIPPPSLQEYENNSCYFGVTEQDSRGHADSNHSTLAESFPASYMFRRLRLQVLHPSFPNPLSNHSSAESSRTVQSKARMYRKRAAQVAKALKGQKPLPRRFSEGLTPVGGTKAMWGMRLIRDMGPISRGNSARLTSGPLDQDS